MPGFFTVKVIVYGVPALLILVGAAFLLDPTQTGTGGLLLGVGIFLYILEWIFGRHLLH